MDPRTRLRHKIKWSLFTKTKKYLTEKVTPFLKKMKTTKENVKISCCDNARKNKAFEENCVKNFEEIKFEFTSPGTPQKSSVVEWVFATLYSRMCTMMAHVGLHENLKTYLWP